MKLLLLGAASSIHLQRWANALADAGLQVHCASMHAPLPSGWHPQVQLHSFQHASPAGYALNARSLRLLMARLGADLLHAHYASGYGVLATLSGCRPRVVSVWGSDVFEFPQRSVLHRLLLRWVLRSADAVAGTSLALQQRTRSVMGCQLPMVLTPFGVDTALFRPAAKPEAVVTLADNALAAEAVAEDAATVGATTTPLTIGTTKGVDEVYGADLLLRAFAQLVQRAGQHQAQTAGQPHAQRAGAFQTLRLRISGPGSAARRQALQALAQSLGVAGQIELTGALPHADIPAELQRLDIFVAASRQESFGVAVLEALACGVPVVATRVGGLPEVVESGTTGLLVPPEDVTALAQALHTLAADADLRQRMGAAGVHWVASRYAWGSCVQQMLGLYKGLLAANP